MAINAFTPEGVDALERSMGILATAVNATPDQLIFSIGTMNRRIVEAYALVMLEAEAELANAYGKARAWEDLHNQRVKDIGVVATELAALRQAVRKCQETCNWHDCPNDCGCQDLELHMGATK